MKTDELRTWATPLIMETNVRKGAAYRQALLQYVIFHNMQYELVVGRSFFIQQDGILFDGLTDVYNKFHMVSTIQSNRKSCSCACFELSTPCKIGREHRNALFILIYFVVLTDHY